MDEGVQRIFDEVERRVLMAAARKIRLQSVGVGVVITALVLLIP